MYLIYTYIYLYIYTLYIYPVYTSADRSAAASAASSFTRAAAASASPHCAAAFAGHERLAGDGRSGAGPGEERRGEERRGERRGEERRGVEGSAVVRVIPTRSRASHGVCRSASRPARPSEASFTTRSYCVTPQRLPHVPAEASLAASNRPVQTRGHPHPDRKSVV